MGPRVRGTGEKTCLIVFGEGSQSRMAAFWMITERATMASMGISIGCNLSRRSTSRSTTAPTRPTPSTAKRLATKKFTPQRLKSVKRKKAPSMKNSPWAKLTTRMMPKISVRPIPMRA